MRIAYLIVCLVIAVSLTSNVFAADSPNTLTATRENGDTAASLDGIASNVNAKMPENIRDYLAPILTLREYALSFAILGFGLCVLLMEFIQFSRKGVTANPQDILLVYAMTLIIIGTMFLIVVGTSSSQLAPAFGLYGTIVGYLLGKRSTPADTTKAHSVAEES